MAAGLQMTSVDPLMKGELLHSTVTSIESARQIVDPDAEFWSPAVLMTKSSPEAIEEMGAKWSFMFIDGDHEGDGPMRDVDVCLRHADTTAMIVMHDLVAPYVSYAAGFLSSQNGWHFKTYETMQRMGVAWRGDCQPVEHTPDLSLAQADS
jgi:hypothetical protein